MRGKRCQSIFLLSLFASSGVRVMSSAAARIAAVSSVYAAAYGLDPSFSLLEMVRFLSISPVAMIEEGEGRTEWGCEGCGVYKGEK